jgi:hypothetical protein
VEPARQRGGGAAARRRSVGFVVGETVEAVAILVVLVVNAVVGFATEVQAARSMAALRELMGTVAEVERDDRRDEIDASELVPGGSWPPRSPWSPAARTSCANRHVIRASRCSTVPCSEGSAPPPCWSRRSG